MPSIKVMKDGNHDFAECIKVIEEKIQLIQNTKKEIDAILSSGKWTGYAKEQCENMHKLTEMYRRHLSLQYLELKNISTELKNNVNDFVKNSVAKDLK